MPWALRLAATLTCGALIVLASARPTPAPEASASVSPAVRAGYAQAANELLCYCGCARQTIADCTCGVAFGLRDEFERRLAAGESAEAIIASYIAEHGEQSRNVPPHRGFNLLAWWGPAIAILLAGAAVMTTLLVWARRGGAAAAVEPASADRPRTPDEEMRRRIEKDLEEFDA